MRLVFSISFELQTQEHFCRIGKTEYSPNLLLVIRSQSYFIHKLSLHIINAHITSSNNHALELQTPFNKGILLALGTWIPHFIALATAYWLYIYIYIN